MKYTWTFVFVTFFYSYSVCQTWSQPVSITNEGENFQSDFTVGPDGALHVVWCKKVAQFYHKIYYSRSVDDGIVWTEKEDIIHNSSKWPALPHVRVDMLNDVVVCYAYDVSTPSANIYIQRRKNGYWHSPQLVSEGFPGAEMNFLEFDRNNTLYCFWNYASKIYYRYLPVLTNTWSETFQPFTADKYNLYDLAIDNLNVIHCVGTRVLSQLPGFHCVYFSGYQNTWTDAIDIGGPKTTYGEIAINNLNLPSCVWRKFLADSLFTGFELALVKKDTKNSWTSPDIVVFDYAYSHDYAIDNNNCPHVVVTERIDSLYYLVHYQKDSLGWHRLVIEQNSLGFYSNRLVKKGSSLFLIYIRLDSIPNQIMETSLLMRRLEIINATDNISLTDGILLFPNPFDNSLTIQLTPWIKNVKEVVVINPQGKTIKRLISKTQVDQQHIFYWDGTDGNGRPVPSGQYFIRVFADGYSETKPVIHRHGHTDK